MATVITAATALCPVGRGTEQAWASVRAGLSRVANSRLLDRHFEPIRMGLVADEALEPELPPEIDSLPLSARARRMLRLAAPALRTIGAQAGQGQLRLYLGLPELTAAEAPWIKGFALYLGKIAGLTIDAPNSRVIPSGRASALLALELAIGALERDPTRPIVVGAVDSAFDLGLLARLDVEGRVLGPRVMDGFVPAEGAAFLVLSHASSIPESSRGSAITVHGAASAMDPGHRTGTEPARGEGLARAIETLRSQAATATGPVATTFAALNGESFDAKQWGVARTRHSDFFTAAMTLEHPADCLGDAGAALGAILLALAWEALVREQRAGPALVWAASDGELRACALLSRQTQ